ncbi:hypothetical protein L1887_47951 [Cichorium endivia]|nr:hypothetical protein L1887_47951 [Cichorium endivia]
MPSPTPIFVHPSGPCMRSSNGSLISGNPTSYPEGFVEYYFETARTFMDLTLTGTIATFTSLKWVVSHAGGAFPAIEDSIQDFPYAPNYTYAYEIAAIDNASFLSTEEKAAMYGSNYKALFA